MLPLTRCRHCSSKLLQLERLWLLPDGRHVARRRCPECEATDDVTAAPEALWAWCSDLRRHRDRLERTVAELSEGVAVLESLS
jgi:hypothetical protein